MAALTPVDVANMACALLVEAGIESLDDNDKFARLLNLHYDVVREAELKLHAWSFAAIFPDDLEAFDDSGTDSEFRYLYEFPSDFLRPLWMTRDGRQNGVQITWTTWADGIRTDYAGPLKMPYIANLTDPNDFPAEFVQVLAAALAIPVAHALTAKASMIEIVQKAYDRAIDRATTVDAFMKAGGPFVQSWAVARGDTRNWRP